MILGGLKAASFIIVMTLAAGCAGEKTPEPPKAPPPPPPATGPVAFRASQKAFQGTSQFTLTRVTKTALGVFTETSHVDCAAPYAHWLRTKDLTEKGIAEGTTSLQGRPRAHSEEEKLFVFGLSFDRLSGDWESPPQAENNEKSWGLARNAFDPSEECQSMRDGTEAPFVPYRKILTTNKITYQGRRTIDSATCDEYRVTYPDLVFNQWVETSQGGYRKESIQPVEATICLDTTDRLPRQGTRPSDGVSSGDTFTYSYAPFEKIAPPQ